ncbi:MAG: tripartite tricarboxylate transporter permease [Rhodospirillales bacterium]|nr:tripartite tricarboxylate transporter permease [Rhodospirillales bacterium]
MENYLIGIETVFTVPGILAIVVGTAAGIFVGAMPGLGPSLGVALLIPATYGLSPSVGLNMLVALYLAAEYGGSISAVLIGTPGTAAATATVVDGYPLNQKGFPGKAMGASLVGSTIGGIIGGLALMTISEPIARLALKFGPPEYFALAVFGLAIVSSLSSENVLKGLLMATVGIMLTVVGVDSITGAPRFTFGFFELFEGIPFLTALIGLFAIAEAFSMIEEAASQIRLDTKVARGFLTLKECFRLTVTFLRGSVIGVVVGAIPGAGANIAGWIAYDQEKRWSRHPEEFGKGAVEGVAAPESANSSSVGGALVPLLTLGIPGSPTTAVLIGALILHGLQPGPRLFVSNPEVIYGLFVGLIVAYPVLFAMGRLAMGLWVRVIEIPKSVLAPVVLALSVLGAYSIRNLMFDVWLTIGFGVFGYILKKYKFPAAPLVLAMVLGYMAESNYRRGLIMSQGSHDIFLQQPISAVFLILAALSFLWPIVQQVRKSRRAARAGKQ